jgi:hypothetical protein
MRDFGVIFERAPLMCDNTSAISIAKNLVFHKSMSVDIPYAAPEAHGIVNVALHREYFPGIEFIFSQGRKDLYHF